MFKGGFVSCDLRLLLFRFGLIIFCARFYGLCLFLVPTVAPLVVEEVSFRLSRVLRNYSSFVVGMIFASYLDKVWTAGSTSGTLLLTYAGSFETDLQAVR